MKIKRLFVVVLSFLAISFCFNINFASANNVDNIYLGGFPAGFSLQTRGAYINGICEVITENGLTSPAKDAGLKVGDTIYEINEKEVNSSLDIETLLKETANKSLELTILSDGKLDYVDITPAKDLNNKYRLGIFVRDNINGIGTVTYVKNNRIGSLGHPVVDEKQCLLNIVGGSLYGCYITGCVKGERGTPGELRGVFSRNGEVAKVDLNLPSGIYATKINNNENNNFNNLKKIEIGKGEVGKAKIYTTICGIAPKEYDISIVKVDNKFSGNKNFVIKVTDEELLKQTGGIVQGMSGSPIVQNGKLVGAVTHVFINDPTRGFGISIDNMIIN